MHKGCHLNSMFRGLLEHGTMCILNSCAQLCTLVPVWEGQGPENFYHVFTTFPALPKQEPPWSVLHLDECSGLLVRPMHGQVSS